MSKMNPCTVNEKEYDGYHNEIHLFQTVHGL